MITCPQCKRQNNDNLKFCENCGAKLARACPNCGNPVALSAKFCGNCGAALQADEDAQLARLKKLVPKEFAERLLKSRGGVERERRIVTILFSDVKGSTALGEERDPEEVLEIMNGAFDVLIEPIYRYEGTLARLMGDAILAFFGAPVAHEDDPVRAVLAALAIQQKMPEYAAAVKKKYGAADFAVRVGINTGLVVVGEVGSDLRVEYTAMGDAINVASRLEGAAKSGAIVISENTARLVRHAVDLESLGRLELKGKAEPVPAYQVTGRKARPESPRGLAALHSPLVGRDRELQTLKSCIQDLERGRGQILSVMGEAGLGKSRLTAELRAWAAEGDQTTAAPRVAWLEGRSLSYETTTPYAPFVDLFSTFFGLQPEEKDLDKYARVKAKIAELAPGQENEMAPFVATLLGIELIGEDLDRVRYLMPPDLRERIFRTTAALLERATASRPLVLLFEDLHWADPTSLELALRLMELTEHKMLAILALFRPQRQDPSWRFHETAARDYAHRYTSVELQPLDESNSRQLVANLLEIEDLPESVRALILKKAEGNPFFVEEVIRSLLDARLVVREDSRWRATREIVNMQVPDTLAAVITARLDRLDDDAKRVVQTASVIGREFQRDVLDDVYEVRQELDGSLRQLQRRELIREKSRLPFELYLFKHALTQEAAYASVLLSRRRDLHRRVANCLERVDPERVNDIARHLLEAKEEARALPYLIAAGERAARAYSTSESIGYYRRAVEIARAGDNQSLARRAFEGLGSALAFAFDIPEALKTYEEMAAWAKTHDNVPMLVSALNKGAYAVAFYAGRFPDAQKQLVEAERLAEEHADKAGLTESYFVRCGMCTAMGDFDSVTYYMTQAANFGRELNAPDQIVASLDHTARSHLFMTRFDEAFGTAQEALKLAREIKNRDLESSVLTTIAGYHAQQGDMDGAVQAAQEAAEIAGRIGSMISGIFAPWTLGVMLRVRGDYELALHSFQKSLQIAFPFKQMLPYGYAAALASLGRTYSEIGDVYSPRVAEMHTEALAMISEPGGMAGAGTSGADLGFTALAQDRLEDAEVAFQKGLNSPSMFRYLCQPESQVGLALVALKRNRLDEADDWLKQARTYVEEREMKNQYPLVAYADGQLQFARGEPERALEQFTRADALASEMKLRPIVWQARAGAAAVLDSLGRTAEAQAQRDSVRAMLEEIAALIQDHELRAAFASTAKRSFENAASS